MKSLETVESEDNAIERNLTKRTKITKKSVQSSTPVETITASQKIAEIKNIRESKDNYALSSRLYNVVGHSDPETFRPLLQALASQDSV
jgi:hypothetical protein